MDGRHDYGPYSRGCRCEVCRAAKAERMRKLRAGRRAAQMAFVGGRNHVEGITHGYSGYQNCLCRCEVCTLVYSVRRRQQRADRAVA